MKQYLTVWEGHSQDNLIGAYANCQETQNNKKLVTPLTDVCAIGQILHLIKYNFVYKY